MTFEFNRKKADHFTDSPAIGAAYRIAAARARTKTSSESHPVEMLTVKECAELVSGLSEHTIRQLVAQGKVEYIRAGSGVRGKILVSKASLLKYLGVAD